MLNKLMRGTTLAMLLVLLVLTACGAPPVTTTPTTVTEATAEPITATESTAEPTTEVLEAVTTEATAETITEATAEATSEATEEIAPDVTTAATTEATVEATADTAAAPGTPVTVGMVLVGPINDRGWSQAHFEAMTRLEQEVAGVEFIYVDKVNPADRPNVQVPQVVDDLVGQGAQVIITNSDDFKDGTREAAEAHPDVKFIHISGDDVLTGQNPPNLGNMMGQMEYGKMMAGCAAALQSNTGKIAYLGPLINDETRRLVNSTYLGARHCWTNVRNKPAAELAFKVTWIGFWFNIPGVTLDPTKVATDFISADYDVIISGIDTTEGIVEANKARQAGKEVFAVPYDHIAACDISPVSCLGVPYFNWFPSYKSAIQKVQAGTWQPEWIWLAPDWNDLNNQDTTNVGFQAGPALGEASKQQLDTFTNGLGDGSINLWTGPLKFQDGSEFLAEGATADEKQIWYMPQLLEGIEGQSAPE